MQWIDRAVRTAVVEGDAQRAVKGSSPNPSGSGEEDLKRVRGYRVLRGCERPSLRDAQTKSTSPGILAGRFAVQPAA